MHVRSFQLDGRQCVAASFSEGRIRFADLRDQVIMGEVKLPGDCMGAFDICPATPLLITGGWMNGGVDIWRVPTGEHVAEIGVERASSVLWNRDGMTAAIRSGSSTYVYNRQQNRLTAIRYAGRPMDGCRSAKRGSILVPHARKGLIMEITSAECAACEHRIPSTRTIWAVRADSAGGTIAVTDSQCTTFLLQDLESDPIWTWSPGDEDRSPQVRAFSGDGALLCLWSVDTKQLFVMHASTGELIKKLDCVHVIEDAVSGREMMASSGHIVNLDAGRIEDGVSGWRWWKRAGA